MSAYLSGVSQAKEALGRLPKVTRAAVRKGTRAGAKIVQAKARELTPVRSGALKRGLKVRSLPRSRRWVGTTMRLGVTKGVDVFYGAFVNYGTRHIQARRFLNDAAEQTRKPATGEALRVIHEEITSRVNV